MTEKIIFEKEDGERGNQFTFVKGDSMYPPIYINEKLYLDYINSWKRFLSAEQTLKKAVKISKLEDELRQLKGIPEDRD